ncbi:hypothetical protein SRHO_G00210500 [Serrasalmus rhombeus]
MVSFHNSDLWIAWLLLFCMEVSQKARITTAITASLIWELLLCILAMADLLCKQAIAGFPPRELSSDHVCCSCHSLFGLLFLHMAGPSAINFASPAIKGRARARQERPPKANLERTWPKKRAQ